MKFTEIPTNMIALEDTLGDIPNFSKTPEDFPPGCYYIQILRQENIESEEFLYILASREFPPKDSDLYMVGSNRLVRGLQIKDLYSSITNHVIFHCELTYDKYDWRGETRYGKQWKLISIIPSIGRTVADYSIEFKSPHISFNDTFGVLTNHKKQLYSTILQNGCFCIENEDYPLVVLHGLNQEKLKYIGDIQDLHFFRKIKTYQEVYLMGEKYNGGIVVFNDKGEKMYEMNPDNATCFWIDKNQNLIEISFVKEKEYHERSYDTIFFKKIDILQNSITIHKCPLLGCIPCNYTNVTLGKNNILVISGDHYLLLFNEEYEKLLEKTGSEIEHIGYFWKNSDIIEYTIRCYGRSYSYIKKIVPPFFYGETTYRNRFIKVYDKKLCGVFNTFEAKIIIPIEYKDEKIQIFSDDTEDRELFCLVETEECSSNNYIFYKDRISKISEMLDKNIGLHIEKVNNLSVLYNTTPGFGFRLPQSNYLYAQTPKSQHLFYHDKYIGEYEKLEYYLRPWEGCIDSDEYGYYRYDEYEKKDLHIVKAYRNMLNSTYDLIYKGNIIDENVLDWTYNYPMFRTKSSNGQKIYNAKINKCIVSMGLNDEIISLWELEGIVINRTRIVNFSGKLVLNDNQMKFVTSKYGYNPVVFEDEFNFYFYYYRSSILELIEKINKEENEKMLTRYNFDSISGRFIQEDNDGYE